MMLWEVCPAGDHEKVPPPIEVVAVSVADCPAQMVGELTETVGAELTVTIDVAELEHPPRE
jgi:hypothetical protein